MSDRRAIIGIVALFGLVALAAGTASAGQTPPKKKDDDEPTPPGDEPKPFVVIDPTPFFPPDPGTPKPGFDPENPFAPVDPGEPVPPTDDGPPLHEIVKDFPEGGAFYQVLPPDTFGGTSLATSIAYRWLRREAFKAARDVGGLEDAAAYQWSKQFVDSGGAALRNHAIDLIQCMWINDALYGTWGYGSEAKPSPHGRAIRLVPQHADNLQRLQQGFAMSRMIQLRKPSDKGKGNAFGQAGGKHELLWMPELNKQVLWGSGDPKGNASRLTTEGPTWGDGSSKMFPPPWVMDLPDGPVIDFSGSNNEDWGC